MSDRLAMILIPSLILLGGTAFLCGGAILDLITPFHTEDLQLCGGRLT